MEKKILEGKIISVPIDFSDVRLCDEKGFVITDESKLPLVYNKDKGVFRIIGWTSKMSKTLHLKNIRTGEELPYAPMEELKTLCFEYYNTLSSINERFPIISEVDYTFLQRSNNIIDVDEKSKVKCYLDYYEVDNTEEANKNNSDTELAILNATKSIYYAKLSYTPDEEWNNIITEAKNKVGEVRPVSDFQEREKVLWNYFKENFYPPTKIKRKT